MVQSFQEQLSSHIIFSYDDILKVFPSFDRKALVRWQEKGYIKRVRNKFYCFNKIERNEELLFFTANKIYFPSYISFESALSYYNIIPEGVYTTISATTLKTNSFDTLLGYFSYRHLKPSLFFGYKLVTYQNQVYKIADLEKAILDYIYLNHKLTSVLDFDGLRWNKEVLRGMDLNTFDKYLGLFNSKILGIRTKNLLNYIDA